MTIYMGGYIGYVLLGLRVMGIGYGLRLQDNG